MARGPGRGPTSLRETLKLRREAAPGHRPTPRRHAVTNRLTFARSHTSRVRPAGDDCTPPRVSDSPPPLDCTSYIPLPPSNLPILSLSPLPPAGAWIVPTCPLLGSVLAAVPLAPSLSLQRARGPANCLLHPEQTFRSRGTERCSEKGGRVKRRGALSRVYRRRWQRDRSRSELRLLEHDDDRRARPTTAHTPEAHEG